MSTDVAGGAPIELAATVPDFARKSYFRCLL